MTALDKLKEDIEFIKKTIEESGTYTNIPASGYITAGVLGICGCLLTYYRLGTDTLSNISAIKSGEILFLSTTWALVFIFAVIAVVCLSILNARKNSTQAWNALASRVFLPQIPVVIVAGILSIALTARGLYELIPAVWLLCYSIMTFYVSYYTGLEHKIQGIIFLVLGILSVFTSAFHSLIFLAIGFGAVNIIFGIVRLLKVIGSHGTEEA
jgi:hypothetical protein